MNCETPTWEASKENVLPTKKGRCVASLKDSLVPSDKEAQELKSAEEAFKTKLSAANDALSRLRIYEKYAKWAREAFPNNANKAKEVLERCTTELKTEPSLFNEQSLVALWVEYADLMRDQAEVFGFLYANKIGERVPLFWVAWAYVAEKDGNAKAADQIYQKGLRRLAGVDKEALTKRYQQFQRRLARQFLNTSSEEAPAPAAAAADSRKRRPGVLAEVPQQTAPPQGSSRPSAQGQALPRGPAPASAALAPKPQGLSFAIFDDSAAAPAGTAEEVQWKCLGKERERRKENAAPATKWTSAALPMPMPAMVSAPSSSSSSASIAIFVDEQFLPSAPAPPAPVSMGIMRKQQHQPPAVPAAVPAPAQDVSAWLAEDEDDLQALGMEEEGTINTRLARQDISLMFQSPARGQGRGQRSRGLDVLGLSAINQADSSDFLHLLPVRVGHKQHQEHEHGEEEELEESMGMLLGSYRQQHRDHIVEPAAALTSASGPSSTSAYAPQPAALPPTTATAAAPPPPVLPSSRRRALYSGSGPLGKAFDPFAPLPTHSTSSSSSSMCSCPTADDEIPVPVLSAVDPPVVMALAPLALPSQDPVPLSSSGTLRAGKGAGKEGPHESPEDKEVEEVENSGWLVDLVTPPAPPVIDPGPVPAVAGEPEVICLLDSSPSSPAPAPAAEGCRPVIPAVSPSSSSSSSHLSQCSASPGAASSSEDSSVSSLIQGPALQHQQLAQGNQEEGRRTRAVSVVLEEGEIIEDIHIEDSEEENDSEDAASLWTEHIILKQQQQTAIPAPPSTPTAPASISASPQQDDEAYLWTTHESIALPAPAPPVASADKGALMNEEDKDEDDAAILTPAAAHLLHIIEPEEHEDGDDEGAEEEEAEEPLLTAAVPPLPAASDEEEEVVLLGHSDRNDGDDDHIVSCLEEQQHLQQTHLEPEPVSVSDAEDRYHLKTIPEEEGEQQEPGAQPQGHRVMVIEDSALTAFIERRSSRNSIGSALGLLLEHREHHRDRIGEDFPLIPLHVHPLCPRPALLGYRSRYAASAVLALPCGRSLHPVGSAGRGSFGHAILLHSLGGAMERCVLKVEAEGVHRRGAGYVDWEAFLHTLLLHRLRGAGDYPLLRPLGLYRFRDCSALLLPYADLGTLIDVLAVLAEGLGVGAGSGGLGLGFSAREHEHLAASLSTSLLSAVHLLHSHGVLHCDLKTDNLLLLRTPEGVGQGWELKVIDLGKARLSHTLCTPSAPIEEVHRSVLLGTSSHTPSASTSILYRGSVAAKGYGSTSSGVQPWAEAQDYYSLLSCCHQLLFFEQLATTEEVPAAAASRGFCTSSLHPSACSSTSSVVTVPRCSLRRYWDRPLWASVYMQLLNPDPLTPHPLGGLAQQMQQLADRTAPPRECDRIALHRRFVDRLAARVALSTPNTTYK